MTCKICNEVKDGKKIYEDDYVVAFLPSDSTVPGHIKVTTKKHYTIFEHLSDYETGHVFSLANKISLVLVNYLQMGGVNLLVNNGVEAGQTEPHFVLNIVPRTDNDGLNFTWQTKQPEDLTEVQNKILSALKEPEKEPEKEEKPEKEEESDENVKEDEDYLIKSIDRIP